MAPRGFFLTKIYHPNVDSTTGAICVNTLKKDWTTSTTLSHVLNVIRCLLIVPFPESSLNDEAGRLFMESYTEYYKRSKLMADVHGRSSSYYETVNNNSNNNNHYTSSLSSSSSSENTLQLSTSNTPNKYSTNSTMCPTKGVLNNKNGCTNNDSNNNNSNNNGLHGMNKMGSSGSSNTCNGGSVGTNPNNKNRSNNSKVLSTNKLKSKSLKRL